MPNELVVRDIITETLSRAVGKGGHGLDVVPGLVKRALKEEAWKERFIRATKQEFPGFPSFEIYVVATPPEGLGASMELIEKLVKGDDEAETLLTHARQKPGGGNPRNPETGRFEPFVDNVNGRDSRPTGNTSAAALRRLSKDAPELHREVLVGKLSAHAAMVQAGFRPHTLTIPLNPESAARLLRKHFSPDALARLRELLDTGDA